MSQRNNTQAILARMTQLLSSTGAQTQRELADALNQSGFQVSQPQVSRYLSRLNAIKVKKANRQTVYQLPGELGPPAPDTSLRQFVRSVMANDTLVIIRTSPGAAPMIGRLLDHHLEDLHALGCVAGDDTLLIAPKSLELLPACLQAIKDMLGRPSHS